MAPIDLAGSQPETGPPKLSPTTWIINSVRNWLKDAPEPRLLGQARPLHERAPAESQGPASPAEPETAAEPASSAPIKRAHAVTTNGKPQPTPAPFQPPGPCRPCHRRLTPPRSCSATRT